MSCATNVVVAGLSSRQLCELMPAYFEGAACSTATNADDSSVGGHATTWSVTLMVVSTCATPLMASETMSLPPNRRNHRTNLHVVAATGADT